MLTATEMLRDVLIGYGATDPLFWARAHRVMPDGGYYSITRPPHRMPYLRDVYRAIGNLPVGGRIVTMKCAQTGWTELAINSALWFMDHRREGVLYMLPSDRVLSDMAQARIDKAIRLSGTLRAAFSDITNVGLKVGFGQPLYLRGAHSLEKLREIGVGMIVRDELQVMPEEAAEQALSRLGASRYKYVIDLSNPQFPETGIHTAYMGGTQETWQLWCPCGERAEPRWPDSIADVDGVQTLVCPKCKRPLDKANGAWVAGDPEAPYRSFRMSQLVSPTVTPAEIVAQYNEARGNATRMQVFYNMTLGLPYAPEGARITDEVLAALSRSGEMLAGSVRPTVMGVDVGAVLHVVIRRIEGGIIWAGTTDWVGVARLMGTYNVQRCAIDAAPEVTKAKELARAFPGRVVLVRYLGPASLGDREAVEDGVTILSVNRTEAIDNAVARLLNAEESIPTNLPEDFYRHVKAITRQIVQTGQNEHAVWVESGPDHYAHALTYSEIVRDDTPIWARIGLY